MSDFSSISNSGGILISDYQQGLDPVGSRKHPSGFCSGVSVQWLWTQAYNEVHASKKKPFWIKKDNPKAGQNKFVIDNSTVVKIYNTQTNTMNAWSKFDKKLIGKTGFDNYTPTLCREGFLTPIRPPTTGQVGEPLTKQLQKAHFVNLNVELRIVYVWGENAGHAMASTLRTAGIQFMDPNEGEVLFMDKKKFASWFTEYCKDNLSDYNGFVLYRYILQEVKTSKKKKKK